MKECTAEAKEVWFKIHPNRPWPKGWKVFLRKMHHYGWCSWSKKRITLNSISKHNIIETLIHEFVHMHFKANLKHGQEFRSIQGRWMEKFYGESRPVKWIDKLYDPKTGKKL